MRRASVLFLLFASGCAISPTRIHSSWSDPTFTGPGFGRVAVLALFDTEAESRSFEREAVVELTERGVDAIPGRTIIEPDIDATQEQMERALASADVEGLLIFRLIAVDERQVYRPPTAYLRSMPPGIVWGDPFYWYYYPHWHYYWHWRSSLAVTSSPGYWEEYTYVTVESSLYDNDTGRLVWTAKSETLDNDRFDRLAGSVANEIVDMLADLALLVPAETGLAEASR